MFFKFATRVFLAFSIPMSAVTTAALFWRHELGFSGSDVLALLPVTSPQAAVLGMHLPDGFQASVVAAEPDIAQPIAMATDAQGRLWVAECRTYPNWNVGHGDQVVIFSDRDADGSFETRSVFCGGLANLSGIEIGLGGVWLICTPNLLFIPDRDADGQPDGPARVMLDGWDDQPRMAPHVANSLTWGPDGWLYGCLGGSSDSLVGAPGAPADRRVALDAAVWRYHPSSGAFEVFASGTNNPWGLDFDETGELYISNSMLAHLWEVVPGGRYERLGPYLKSPASYEWMNSCANHNHWGGGDQRQPDPEKARLAGGGHAHSGLTIYQGDNWPGSYRGAALMCNLQGRSINHDELALDRDEPLASHAGDVLVVEDSSFRGVDLECGPDGTLFVADWNARGSCLGSDTHASNPTGRIYRISFGPPPGVSIDLDRLPDEELVMLHSHANVWFSRRARLVLQDRSYRGTLQPKTRNLLAKLIADSATSNLVRLRAFWTWHVVSPCGSIEPSDDLRLTLLEDSASEVRAWAVRLSAEAARSEDVPRWVKMAKTESVRRVQRELISTLHRLPIEERLRLAEAVLPGMSNLQPRNWQRLCWYAIEPLIERQPEPMIELDKVAHGSLINFAIARRIAELWSGDPESPELGRAFESLLCALTTSGDDWRTATLQGVTEGLRACRGVSPPVWSRIRDQLLTDASPVDATLIALIAAQVGGLDSEQNLIAMARDRGLTTVQRLTALTGCLAQPNEAVQRLVLDLSADPDPALRRKALQSIAIFDCDLTPLFARYGTFDRDERRCLIESTTARASHARQLLNQVEADVVSVTEIDATAARQLLTLNDSSISARLQQSRLNSGRALEASSAERQRVTQLLTVAGLAGTNTANGEAIFTRHCAHCHRLHGNGGRIGPELTGSQRNDLGRMIIDITEPNAVVGRQFQATLIRTTDGQVITGIVAEETPQIVVLSTPNDPKTVNQRNIASQRLLPESLMPTGLLANLSDRDVRDLFAYLMAP
jgi:putative membrane-bound dehydrogenase-like protein